MYANSISEQVIETLRKNYCENMAFLAEYFPPLYELFSSKGKAEVEINVTPMGKVELGLKGRRLKEYSFEAIKEKLESFYKNPSRISRQTDDVLSMDRECYHINTLKKLDKLFSSFSQSRNRCTFDKNFIPLIALFGIGPGYHIEALIEISNVRYMILVERDIELLKPSLYTLNWKKILKHFSGENRQLFIFVNDDVERLSRDVLAAIHQSHPMFSYYSFFLQVSTDKIFEKLLDDLSQRQHLLYQGWGFFDDELCSIVQTAQKIKKGIPVLTNRNSLPQKSTAFIVGSGPSLDDTIDIVKKEQSNAIIFSCGTAIKALEREGIKPDYHIELERPAFTYEVLKESVSKEFWEDVILIGSNPLYPKVMELADKKAMFLKNMDAGISFFDGLDYPVMPFSSPTVTNSALSIALTLGFENIFFFGVDLGWRDSRGRHHSQKSAYYDKKHFLSKSSLACEVIYEDDLGKVFSTGVFIWTKKHLEELIRRFPQNRFFQVGEGGAIEGAARLFPEDFKGNEEVAPKDEVIHSIQKNISSDYLKKINLKKRLKKSKKNFFKITEFIKKNIQNDCIKNRESFIDFACRRNRKLMQLEDKDHLTFILLRGTLWHIETFIYIFSNLIIDDKLSREFLKQSLSIYYGFIIQAEEVFRQLILSISASSGELTFSHNKDTYYFVKESK